MKYECDLIEDLLPLYKDGICSDSSRTAVEEHLAECEKCRDIYEKLKDETVDELMIREKEDVIGSQSKFFKRKSALAGSIIAAIFALPILICLIVNLAEGNGLGWFFIVLAAMLLPTTLIVVPLMVPENKMFTTMTSFTLSIIILLGAICLYTRGNWFFITASSVLFGLTVCFAPFIANRRPLAGYLKNYKGLTVMGAYTVTFCIMMICIGIHANAPFWPLAFAICTPLIAMVWIIFAIVRYLPVNGLAKTGLIMTVIGIIPFIGNKTAEYFTLKNATAAGVTVISRSSLNSAIYAAVIAIGVILSVIGIAVGMIKKETDKGEEK